MVPVVSSPPPQREMSQLERQYEELEEVGREIEQALRDANESEYYSSTLHREL